MIERAKGFLKKLSIDNYILLILALFGIVLIVLFGRRAISLRTLSVYYFFGGPFLLLLFSAVYFYFAAKIFIVLVDFQKPWRSYLKKVGSQLTPLVKSQIYFTLVVALGLLFSNFLINLISYVSPQEKVFRITHLVANFDFLIFGVDSWVALSGFVNNVGGRALSYILIQSYDMISFMIPLLFIILFLHNKLLAKKFIVFFFLAPYIAFPFWLAFPVISPLEIYVFNSVQTPAPQRIAQNMQSYNPDAVLTRYQSRYFNHYSKDRGYDTLTTFPSMHAAWGLGVVMYAFRFFAPLGLAFLAWFFLQMAGAVYLGQHFLIDLFLGAVLAIAVFYIIEKLYVFEKKYYKGKGSFFIIDIIQQDYQKVKNFVQNVFKRS